MGKLQRYIFNLLVSVDELGSALTGGDPDETISSRLGKSQRGDYGPKWQRTLAPMAQMVDWVFHSLTGQVNHCAQSIEEDEGASELLL